VEEGGQARVKVGFILLDALKVDARLDLFHMACGPLQEGVGRLLSPLALKTSRLPGRRFQNRVHRRLDPVLVHEKLPGRAQLDGAEVFLRTLGQGVKATDGVDLVVKEVDANRRLFGDGKDVEDASPHAKL